MYPIKHQEAGTIQHLFIVSSTVVNRFVQFYGIDMLNVFILGRFDVDWMIMRKNVTPTKKPAKILWRSNDVDVFILSNMLLKF